MNNGSNKFSFSLVNLKTNIRFYILLSAFVLSVLFVLYDLSYISGRNLRLVRLQQQFGFASIGYLYLALLATPVTKLFNFRFKQAYIKSRRALGVSVFYFAALHGFLVFFDQLGGFSGLGFLEYNYILGLVVGLVPFIIFAALTATSFDKAVDRMGYKNWKTLHRLVYIAGVLSLIHAAVLGSHFQNLYNGIPMIMFGLLAVFIILETFRLNLLLVDKFPKLAQSKALPVTVAIICIGFYGYASGQVSIGRPRFSIFVHDRRNSGVNRGVPTGSSYTTQKFSIDLDSHVYEPGKTQELVANFYEDSSGQIVEDYVDVKGADAAEVVIISDDFEHYDLLSAKQEENGVVFETEFPKDGRYNIYYTVAPAAAPQQVVATSIIVGKADKRTEPIKSLDKSVDRVVGDYKLSINKNIFDTDQYNLDQDIIELEVSDAKTGEPVTKLESYKSDFAHLDLIEKNTYEYIITRPISDGLFTFDDATAGPLIRFDQYQPQFNQASNGDYRAVFRIKIDNKVLEARYDITLTNQ